MSPEQAEGSDVDLSDAIYTLAWSFLGGPPPLAPEPYTCGVAPTGNGLGCAWFVPCVGG